MTGKKSMNQLLLFFCLHTKNHLQSYKEQNKLKREFTPQLGDNTKKALLTNYMAEKGINGTEGAF